MAICPESVGKKDCDSILGDSPSPTKQVGRYHYQISSPCKYSPSPNKSKVGGTEYTNREGTFSLQLKAVMQDCKQVKRADTMPKIELFGGRRDSLIEEQSDSDSQ